MTALPGTDTEPRENLGAGNCLSEPQTKASMNMVKMMVLYGPPTDRAAFEDYYASTHVPIAAKTPNVARFEAGRVVATPDGTEPLYYRLAEVWFEREEALQAAMASPAGPATVADVSNFATGGATVLIAQVDEPGLG
jgi:uncharacterized protein (TIGR02118 family)